MDRPIALNEYAEFKDVNDMVHKLNAFYLSLQVFRRFQLQGKLAGLCSSLLDKRNGQYVMCPEQDASPLSTMETRVEA